MMEDDTQHEMEVHDVLLRLTLDTVQDTDPTSPEQWEWNSLLDLKPHEKAEVKSYMKYASTITVDDEGNSIQTIDSELVEIPDIVEALDTVADLAMDSIPEVDNLSDEEEHTLESANLVNALIDPDVQVWIP